MALRETERDKCQEYNQTKDAFHNLRVETAKIHFFDDMQISDESCIFAHKIE